VYEEVVVHVSVQPDKEKSKINMPMPMPRYKIIDLTSGLNLKVVFISSGVFGYLIFRHKREKNGWNSQVIII